MAIFFHLNYLLQTNAKMGYHFSDCLLLLKSVFYFPLSSEMKLTVKAHKSLFMLLGIMTKLILTVSDVNYHNYSFSRL